MPVWLRRLLFVLLGLVFLLSALGAWLVSHFDANHTKSVAEEWMKTHRNRSLAIDGPIELSVFPRLAIKLSKVRLSEVGTADEFLALDSAALAAELLPLLHGELVIGNVQAQGVRVHYLRSAKGQSNIDDLLQPAPAEPTEPAGGKPVRFDIRGIALTDVRVRVKDDSTGVNGELFLKSLKTGRIANQVEADVALESQFDFKSPVLRGTLGGTVRLTVDTDAAAITLRDMHLAFKGETPVASEVDAKLQGGLAWKGGQGMVNAQALELTLAANAGDTKFSGTTLAVEQFAFDAHAKSLTLRRLRAHIKGVQGARPVTLDLDWPELAVTDKTLSGSALSGKLALGGPTPLEASFKSAAPSGNFDAVRLPGFEVRSASSAAQRRLDANLQADLTLQLTPAALNIDQLELQATLETPKLEPLKVALRGSAQASAQRSGWKLSGQFNTQAFSSEGSVISTGGTPTVVAKARFDTLDLNRWMSDSAPSPAAPQASVDAPVDLSALLRVNGRFSAQIANFAVRQYRVADARMAATLDAGVLRITELRGKAWGGQVDATGSVNAHMYRAALKGTANAVNVNALVKDLAAKDLIAGTGRVSVDLDTTGHSVGEMKSHLHGSAALQVRDGAIKGINIAKSLRQVKAALAMRQDTSQESNQAEKTDFSELSASFQIDDGVARNHDLEVKSPYLRLGGEGSIDIGKGRIDYVARATTVATAKGQDGSELTALQGLTVPVRLMGPFDALDWRIEWSAVAASAARHELQDKLTERLGLKAPASAASGASPQDLLKEKLLKKLFK